MEPLGHVVLSDEIKDNTKETFDYFESQGVEGRLSVVIIMWLYMGGS